ncbi:MAG: hypothetical protein ABGX12_03360 [Desulfurobacteriaceae bacterium]
MSEFEKFLKLFIKVELFLFLILTGGLILLKGTETFTWSFVLGYGVMSLDFFLLVRFSKRVPELVSANIYPKSGFLWRYLLVGGVLVLLSLFTPIDFFAIISAVAASQIGLFLAVILYSRERKRWNTAA